jgi:acyl-[acyl carrier protein]--UDP-N-acetylglucosamine O-acyltransferase
VTSWDSHAEISLFTLFASIAEVAVLSEEMKINPFPTVERRAVLARQLKMTPRRYVLQNSERGAGTDLPKRVSICVEYKSG